MKPLEPYEEEVTPLMAKVYRSHSRNHRRKSPRHSANMARQMKLGLWRRNGESIKFEMEGYLVDGQNRIEACIMAGVPFITAVFRNVESAAEIDEGVKRQYREHLQNCGEKNAKILAAIVKKIWLINLDKKDIGSTFFSPGGAPVKPTEAELDETLAAEKPVFYKAVTLGRRAMRLGPPSLLGTLAYLFIQKEELMAESFFEMLLGGKTPWAEDPIHLLRDKLNKNRRSSDKLPPETMACFFIKVWNAWRTNRALKQLSWRRYGDGPEQFPSIK